MAVDRLVACNLDMNSVSRIKNLPAPASDNEPARLADLNSVSQGLGWKDNVRVATQSNVNLSSPGSTIDGITMASGDRVLVKAQTAPAENGLYIWSGAASLMSRAADASTAVELESAVTIVDEGTNAGQAWRQTQVNFTLDSGDVTWAAFPIGATGATESAAGIAEIATQAEVDAGTDTARYITPEKLLATTLRTAAYKANFGDGSATQFDLTHNLNSRDVTVAVYRVASPYDTVDCGVERTTVNAVRLNFTFAPTTNQFRIVVERAASA